MSTQHEYERYRDDLTGDDARDPQHYLKIAIVLCVLGLALLYPIFCAAQDLPPGAPSAGMVLRLSAGSSGTGTQPPFAPTTRPASSTLEQDGTGASASGLEVQRVVRLEEAPTALGTPGQSRADGVPGSSDARPAPKFLPLALTYAGLQIVDFGQTTAALNSGRYREANGALSGIAGSPWKLGLVKGAVTSGSLLGIYAMRKSHTKASRWLLVSLVGAQSVVCVWNAKEMR